MLFAAFAALFVVLWGVVAITLPVLRNAGALIARLIARASVRWVLIGDLTGRFRSYVPTALVVVIGALVTAWAGNQFLDLAELVRAKNPAVEHFDSLVHDWAVSERSAGSTAFFLVMTTTGAPRSSPRSASAPASSF